MISLAQRLALAMSSIALAAHAQHHLFSFEGREPGDFLGYSVAKAGDVDRDGVPDIVAGKPTDARNGASAGAVLVFSGRLRQLGWVGNDVRAQRSGGRHR